MLPLHNFMPAQIETRRAPSRRRDVTLRAVLRIVGSDRAHPITVREVSPTQIRGSSSVGLFVGSQVEIEMGALGSIAGRVVESQECNAIAIRLDRAIDPDFLHWPMGGWRGVPPTPAPTSVGLLHPA